MRKVYDSFLFPRQQLLTDQYQMIRRYLKEKTSCVHKQINHENISLQETSPAVGL